MALLLGYSVELNGLSITDMSSGLGIWRLGKSGLSLAFGNMHGLTEGTTKLNVKTKVAVPQGNLHFASNFAPLVRVACMPRVGYRIEHAGIRIASAVSVEATQLTEVLRKRPV